MLVYTASTYLHPRATPDSPLPYTPWILKQLWVCEDFAGEQAAHPPENELLYEPRSTINLTPLHAAPGPELVDTGPTGRPSLFSTVAAP